MPQGAYGWSSFRRWNSSTGLVHCETGGSAGPEPQVASEAANSTDGHCGLKEETHCRSTVRMGPQALEHEASNKFGISELRISRRYTLIPNRVTCSAVLLN